MNIDIRRKKILTTVFILIVTLFVGGISYAFFTANTSNTNNQTAQINTGNMVLVFSDNDNGVSASLAPGESVTKKFTLQNTGSLDAYAKINWYNLVSTYTVDSLTWVLEQSTSANGTFTSIGNGKVPTSSSPTTAMLRNDILVPTGTTYYYKLTITLNNLDIDQTSDLNATFYSYFSLESGRQSGVGKIQALVADANQASTDVITKATPEGANCTNTLAYDGTADNNLRYVGANPCNYVTFNGEKAGWRIIGVMNNIDDGTGNKETRIKLIRKTSLGDYAWNVSKTTLNEGQGINDWSQAVLMEELNGDYLDTSLTSNSEWYINTYHAVTTRPFDYRKVLKAEAQSLIGDAKWNLGGLKSDTDLIPTTMYVKERGTTVYRGRPTEWTGKVALLYPSDYGYATAGGSTTTRSDCIETVSTSNWANDCKDYNWLKPSNGSRWLLTPESSKYNTGFYCHANNGNIYMTSYIDSGYNIFPTVYLKSEVIISGGTGSSSDPYIIG